MNLFTTDTGVIREMGEGQQENKNNQFPKPLIRSLKIQNYYLSSKRCDAIMPLHVG